MSISSQSLAFTVQASMWFLIVYLRVWMHPTLVNLERSGHPKYQNFRPGQRRWIIISMIMGVIFMVLAIAAA